MDEDTGLLEYLATAVHVRAAVYRDKAAVLQKMAEAEPIGSLRNGLLHLSRQFEGMAKSIDTKRQPRRASRP